MLLGKAIRDNAILLALFAVITGGGISFTYVTTKDAIKKNVRAAEEAALLEIMPREQHDNAMLDDSFWVSDTKLLKLTEEKKGYLAKKDGRVIGAIYPATAPDGYGGSIHLITGVYANGQVAGVRVLVHRETPGLGDKVELKKSDWITSFDGKSLDNPKPEKWKVKKDKGVFDQFTGATITPRAVTAAVFRTLQYHKTNFSRLIAKEAQGETPDE